MSGSTSKRPRFVVRTGGAWILTEVGQPSTAVSLDDLLRLIGAPAPVPASAPMGHPEPHVEAWCWVARLVEGALEVERSGEPARLDASDLQLIEAVGNGTGSVPCERTERLRGLGLIDIGPPATSERGIAAPAPIASEPFQAPRASKETAVRPDGSQRRSAVSIAWQPEVGPMLAHGMLTAALRHWNGGALTDGYEIHRPALAHEVLEQVRASAGPPVLLCSNYVWSLEANLDLAAEARRLRPDTVVIHGGPSTPKYEAEAAAFLHDHRDLAHILVRGEGEVTICELLEGLEGPLDRATAKRLRSVPGITYTDPDTGLVVRTPDRERLSDLDALPSPYLTGEFDHIEPSAWVYLVPVETNRGCPYRCSFCDWGSATQSRIRKFSMDRIRAEIDWAARHGAFGVQLCDANFGILARDLEVAEALATARRRHGLPAVVAFTPAKNTVRHLQAILDTLIEADLLISAAISLQTTDEQVLAAVDRSNIATASYLELAACLRQRSLPLLGDVLIGLPGQTYETYRRDIQFFLDHEIAPRSWSVRLLPNAPMNEPGYRTAHGIRVDAEGMVIETSTFTAAARGRMLRLRKAQVIAEQFTVLSHVLRLLQWDHQIPMVDALERLNEVTRQDPHRYDLLAWLLEHFDAHPTAPVGWSAIYRQVARFIGDELGVDPRRSDVQTVLALQEHLMPAPGRRFPSAIHLDHDYVSYYRSATAGLWIDGVAADPPAPLASHPPATFEVEGDPLGLCARGPQIEPGPHDERMLGNFWIGLGSTYELASPLQRVDPSFRNADEAQRRFDRRRRAAAPDSPDPTPVALPAR